MVEKGVKVLMGNDPNHPMTNEHLQRLCDNSKEIEITDNTVPRGVMPPVIGVAKNLRVEGGCVVADFHMKEGSIPLSAFKRRGCEVWPKEMKIDPIMMFDPAPTRDLGLYMMPLSPGAGVPAVDPRECMTLDQLQGKVPPVTDPRMEIVVKKVVDRINRNWEKGLNEEQRKFREDLLALMRTPDDGATIEEATQMLLRMGQPIEVVATMRKVSEMINRDHANLEVVSGMLTQMGSPVNVDEVVRAIESVEEETDEPVIFYTSKPQ